LLRQDYPGRVFQVIVVDDNSDDGDARGRRAPLAAEAAGRLTIVQGGRACRPAGPESCGAVTQGVARAEASGRARPITCLLTDGRYRIRTGCAGAGLVRRARGRRGWRWSSLMAKLRCRSLPEGARWWPAFIFFFQMLYPFKWGQPGAEPGNRRSGRRLHAGAARRARQGPGESGRSGHAADDDRTCALAAPLEAAGSDLAGTDGAGSEPAYVPRLPPTSAAWWHAAPYAQLRFRFSPWLPGGNDLHFLRLHTWAAAADRAGRIRARSLDCGRDLDAEWGFAFLAPRLALFFTGFAAVVGRRRCRPIRPPSTLVFHDRQGRGPATRRRAPAAACGKAAVHAFAGRWYLVSGARARWQNLRRLSAPARPAKKLSGRLAPDRSGPACRRSTPTTAFARAADDVADHARLRTGRQVRASLERPGSDAAGKEPDRESGRLCRCAARNLRERGVVAPRPRPLDLADPRFRLDVTKHRYRELGDELMHYTAATSAMPVGRFVLELHGGKPRDLDAKRSACAPALQVINHLQDCAKDYAALDPASMWPLDALERTWAWAWRALGRAARRLPPAASLPAVGRAPEPRRCCRRRRSFRSWSRDLRLAHRDGP